MNKVLITLLVSGVLAANAQAAGQDNTWYGGAKLGWSNFYGIDNSNAITLTDESNDTLGAGLFVGYQLNSMLGLEFGYDWLGKYQYHGTRTTGPVSDKLGAELQHLSLKLGVPLTEQLDLYGRLGGAYASTDSDSSIGDHDNRLAFLGALGAEYAFNLDWAARLEYQYTSSLGDRDELGIRMDNGLLSLGVLYRFGQQAPSVAVPAPAPAPVPAPVQPARQFRLSSDVLFDFNKASLKLAAGQALDELYRQITEARPSDGAATVVGYTDRIGSSPYNQKLSEQRARIVADYLIGKGLPAAKVLVTGRGEADPVTGTSCASKTKSELIVCLAPDRRVEVKVEGITEVQQ